MEMRDYQVKAVNSIFEYVGNTDHGNPLIVIPTGGGKGFIMGAIAEKMQEWGARLLILAHVKELVEQNAEQAGRLLPFGSVGTYSAGLKRKDTAHQVISAGIQSVHKKATELGGFDMILVDECHRLPSGDEGTYQSFLADIKVMNPKVRLVGLTATPFRMKEGHIAGDGGLFDDIAYEVGVRQLISQGYLSRVVSKVTRESEDFSGLHSRAGEFVAEEVDMLMDKNIVVQRAVDEFVMLCKDRKSIMLFCCSVKHAKHVAERLRERTGETVNEVYGDIGDAERDRRILEFKSGQCRWLVNVAVLTTGFDHRPVDCIVMLRPTKSTGLWQQIVGRGLRIADGKENCMVLDYGGNIERHGPIDAPRLTSMKGKKGDGDGSAPTRVCDECLTVCLAAYRKCPECGFEFERKGEEHETNASNMSILSTTEKKREWREVKEVYYQQWDSKSGNVTMMVKYEFGVMDDIREWVCIEHEQGSFARKKAVDWWTERSIVVPVPQTADEAVELGRQGAIAKPIRVQVEHPPEGTEGWPKIIGFELEEKPEWFAEASMKKEEREDDFFTYEGNEDTDDDMPF
jgi:DNA repair protein RadD